MKDDATPELHSVSRKWSYTTGDGAVIWQLMFPETGHVVGQKRVPATRRTSFFCLSSESGQVLSDDFVLFSGTDPDSPAGDGWLVGFETTLGELVYCHAYAPGTPEHRGIWAVDLPGRQIVWQRPDIVFAANLGTSFLAYRTSVFAGFPERDYLLLDPVTGRDLELLGRDHERANVMRLAAETEESRQGIILPRHAPPQDDGSGQASPEESIMLGELRIDAVHRNCPPAGWESRISVSLGERMVYVDLMATGARRLPFNNFLIRDFSLYYIKGNDELICVNIL